MCGAPHNDSIIDCKVPGLNSAQTLCQGALVPACATCMSKQLSQIYSLAQVSACNLAHVPSVRVHVHVHVRVIERERERQKEFALSELGASRGLI